MNDELVSDENSGALDAALEVDEFADYQGDPVPLGRHLHWRQLLDPRSLRGLAALIAGIFFLFSEQNEGDLAFVVAVVVIVWGVAEVASRSSDRRRLSRFLTPTVLVGLGVALLVWPDITGRVLALLIGGVVILAGVRDLSRGLRPPNRSGVVRWWVIRGLLEIVLGVSVLVASEVVVGIVVTFFGLFWIITGIATAVANVSMTSESVDVTDVWGYIFEWLEQRPQTADDRHQLYDKVFYEGARASRRLSRFVLLMGFATTIAAFGIASDSTAVVIGAMLVAPLMTPLMGTSLSLVMGWPKRAGMSAGVAFIGIALAIGLSAIYGAILTFPVDPVTNSQVASRIAPTLVDLMIAIAAGGAGAFALSRPDVSDALPGVAVAIALVPPLAVVGLMLEGGNGEDALGALLLFVTNMVAILLVGAIVFLLTGVVPVRTLVTRREWVRNGVAMVAIVGVVVVTILGTTGEEIRAQAFDRSEVETVVDTWLEDRDLEVFSIEVSRDSAEVVVVGADPPGSVEDLDRMIEAALGRPMTVLVRYVPEQRFESDR